MFGGVGEEEALAWPVVELAGDGVEELPPLPEAGTTVLLDRFVDSSLRLPGAGRGLGVEEIRALNAFGLEAAGGALAALDSA